MELLQGDLWEELVTAYGNGRRAVVDAVLRRVVPGLADAAVVTLLRPDGVTLDVVGTHAEPGVHRTYLDGLVGAGSHRLGQGLAGVVAATAETLVLPEVPDRSAGIGGVASGYLGWFPPSSLAIVPLVAGGRRPVGTLGAVRTDTTRRFTAADQLVLEHLAEHVALALAHLERGDQSSSEADVYRAVFEHADDGILVLTEDGRVLAANPAACRILRVAEAEIGRDGTPLLIPDDRAATGIDLRERDGRARVEVPMRRGDGEPFVASISRTAFRAADGQLRTCVSFRDVTQEANRRAELEQRSDALGRLALEDDLTQLLNRRGFRELATQALAIADREEAPVTLLYLDLDGLKAINDRYGHAQGDHALQAVARALAASTRSIDVTARTGGDEFVALLFGADADAAGRVIGRIDHVLAIESAALDVTVSVSVGTAVREPGDTMNLDDLVVRADRQMYRARPRQPAR